MKKAFSLLLLIIVFIFLFGGTVYANNESLTDDIEIELDDAIEQILSGINEKDFENLTNVLNDYFNDKLTLKERIISFITGDTSINFNSLKNYFVANLSKVFSSVIGVVLCVIFIGVLYSISNIIISKTNGNNDKYAIYLICIMVLITLFTNLVLNVFSSVKNTIETTCKLLEVAYPVMITLSEFSGGFGVTLFKPISLSITLITSSIISNFFIPILLVASVSVLVSNISPTIKLNNLSKSLLSLVKWLLGIISVVFTFLLTSLTVVNSQYNGLSFKILKFTTGSMIPIVGNFLSGGLNVLLSSAILVKNSFGLLVVIFIILSVGGSGVFLLATSFVIKFLISLFEPIIDERVVNLCMGICNVISHASAVVFVSGFTFCLVCFSIISSTALII